MIEGQKKNLGTKEMPRRRFLQLTGLAAGAAAAGFPGLLRARGTNGKLNVGFIGVGNMGTARLKEILTCGVNVTALCDVDDHQFAVAKSALPKSSAAPKTFTDYRDLLQSDVDAVVIATPDHWHAPVAMSALNSGKHVFCEKPLAHTISEARALRGLAKQFPQLATQMGNQGSASPNLRRAIEIIQAGALGPVREVHIWVPPSKSFKAGQELPAGEDPVPTGLHWNNWIGPAEFHAYKTGAYHPRAWRAWYDFGGGSMADWGCHGLNLPVRALKLDYPTFIEADVQGPLTASYPKDVRIRFEFAARKDLPPVTIWWYDGGRKPPAEVVPKAITDYYGEMPDDGVLILGGNGFTFGGCHSGANYIQLADEGKMSGILKHAATNNITASLPRSPGHLKEWVTACTGGPATFSDFETGGHLTEIALTGIVALRMQQAIHWDGEAMRAVNASGAEKFVQAHYRADWKL
jgi:predicted dehydrogenase